MIEAFNLNYEDYCLEASSCIISFVEVCTVMRINSNAARLISLWQRKLEDLLIITRIKISSTYILIGILVIQKNHALTGKHKKLKNVFPGY